MRVQRLAVLSSTVIILISGCSAGRSTSPHHPSDGGSYSKDHGPDHHQSAPTSNGGGLRQFEPPPVPPVPGTRGISMTRTISFSRLIGPKFGCGEKPCAPDPHCAAPEACATEDCTPENVCAPESGQPWFHRLKCWPRPRPQAPCIPQAACTTGRPCTQEYGAPLCEKSCGEKSCGVDEGCDQIVPRRCFLSRLFGERLHLFGHPQTAAHCPATAGCTDTTCMNSNLAPSAPRDCSSHPSGPTPPPIFDTPQSSMDHERSPLAEPMQDPFAPAPADQNQQPQMPSAVPAAPVFVAPQSGSTTNGLNRQPPGNEVPSAPETERPMPMDIPAEDVEQAQSWIEPQLWPRHRGVVEPTIVVQPRDFHAQSTSWDRQ